MRRMMLLFACIGAALIAGCGPGVAKTAADRENTYRRVLDMDFRQLNDDWDLLWLADRQYRLTEFYTR